MFGRKPSNLASAPQSQPAQAPAKPAARKAPAGKAPVPEKLDAKPEPDERISRIKAAIFKDLLESVNLAELARMPNERVREEIADVVVEIIAMRNFILSAIEQQAITREVCDDVLQEEAPHPCGDEIPVDHGRASRTA